MQLRIKDGFSILIPASDTIILFGEKLKLSCIATVTQAHRCPRLILNLSDQLDANTPGVNNSTDRKVAPDSLQFGRAFPHILQEVWDTDLVQDPIWVSKLDITDAYHRGTVKPLQVGAFVYVISLSPGEEGCVIFIDLVLLMGWVESPKFFCAFLETLIDVENSLVDTDLPVPSYGAISKIPATGPGPPHTPKILTHIDCYMDGVISVV